MASATFQLVQAPDFNVNIKNKNGFISSFNTYRIVQELVYQF
jgi:hypothetical protein